ncbi:unnamed protein product [Pedinophyceae sp. YPF-701]|nr:unnamed protein product [Pedinophyceae sp. YPF-701]
MADAFGAALESGSLSGLVKALDAAIAACGADPASAPKRAALACNKAWCLLRLHLWNKALAEATAATTLDSGLVRAHVCRAGALRALKRADEAAAALSAARDAATPMTDVETAMLVQAMVKDPTLLPIQRKEHATTQDLPARPQPAPAPAHPPPAQHTRAAKSRSPRHRDVSPPAARIRDEGVCVASSGAEDTSGFRGRTHPGESSNAPHRHTNGARASPSAATLSPASPSTRKGATSPGHGSDAPHGAAAKAAAAMGDLAPKRLAMQLDEATAREIVDQAVVFINQGDSPSLERARALLRPVTESTAPALQRMSAHVALGTARALTGDLSGAVEDFTAAVNLEPRYYDTYKRRAQARAALGKPKAAIEDLEEALSLLARGLGGATSGAQVRKETADVQLELARICYATRDYRRAVAYAKPASLLDPSSVPPLHVLGMAQVSRGDLYEGIATLQACTERDAGLREAWQMLGYAQKELGRVRDAEVSLLKAISLDKTGKQVVQTLRQLAHMRQCQGNHRGALPLLDKAVTRAKELIRSGHAPHSPSSSGPGPSATTVREALLDALLLRAACHHALGQFRAAVEDYEAAQRADCGPEGRPTQFLAHAQCEVCLYHFAKLDAHVDTYNLDRDLPPLLKENWCKKGPPTPALAALEQPRKGLRDLRVKDGDTCPGLSSKVNAEEGLRLVKIADLLGSLVHNTHSGFLDNARQQRMAGLGGLQLAQLLVAAAAERGAGRALKVPEAGASSAPVGPRRADTKRRLRWRDAVDVLVKWRQIAEPNDPVVWVDLLTPEEFAAGFGSHTPMFTGQTKCVRYYMNHDRSLEVFKSVMREQGYVTDAQNQEVAIAGTPEAEARGAAAMAAADCVALRKALGTDCWVCVPIESVLEPGEKLEGTRLTVVALKDSPGGGVEFSIRTPVTPPRWKKFDAELDARFERILDALVPVVAAARADPPAPPTREQATAVAEAALLFAYYWYNLMPLSRGGAVIGYTSVLAAMLAAGVPVESRIPPDTQVDWEAILGTQPAGFVAAVRPWLYPDAIVPDEERHPDRAELHVGAAAQVLRGLDVSSLPAVVDAFPTYRSRIQCLSCSHDRKL